MNNLGWFVRMSRWARHPPSGRMVVLVLSIIAISLVLLGLEKAGMLPDWASMDPRPPRPRLVNPD